MKLWRGQPDNWRPQPMSKGERIGASLALAAVAFYFGIDTWLSNKDPCMGSHGHHCTLANFWAGITGISRAIADAQFWFALGALVLMDAFFVWRKKI